jgi:hypothetical protein
MYSCSELNFILSSASGALPPSWLGPKKTKSIFYCASSWYLLLSFNFHNRVSLGFLQFACIWTLNMKRETWKFWTCTGSIYTSPGLQVRIYLRGKCQFVSNYYRVFPLTCMFDAGWSLERVAVGKKREYTARSDSPGSGELDIWPYIARGLSQISRSRGMISATICHNYIQLQPALLKHFKRCLK